MWSLQTRACVVKPVMDTLANLARAPDCALVRACLPAAAACVRQGDPAHLARGPAFRGVDEPPCLVEPCPSVGDERRWHPRPHGVLRHCGAASRDAIQLPPVTGRTY